MCIRDSTQSVASGLQVLNHWAKETNHLPGPVLIHDGVRPLAGEELMRTCVEASRRTGAAVACVPVKASLRKRTDTGSVAVDRSQFVEVQTPQVFDFTSLLEAYRRRPHDQFTDDASLYEAVFPASRIELVEGHYENLKITTRDDLELARRLIKRAEKPAAKRH
jgi:2-C-methyl-D-erythritol 4-phosphate cytidylyltransferase